MIPVLSVENMRGSDAATIAGGIPGKELMRRAAEGIFAAADWTPSSRTAPPSRSSRLTDSPTPSCNGSPPPDGRRPFQPPKKPPRLSQSSGMWRK